MEVVRLRAWPPPAEIRSPGRPRQLRPPSHHAAPNTGNEFRDVSAPVLLCDLDSLASLVAACGAFERRRRAWHTGIIFSIASSCGSSADLKGGAAAERNSSPSREIIHIALRSPARCSCRHSPPFPLRLRPSRSEDHAGGHQPGQGPPHLLPGGGEWYLIPHDELLDWVATNINIADATSWTSGGGYSFATLSAALKTHLQQYRLATDRP